MMSADAIAEEVFTAICDDLRPAGQDVLLLVNGMGGTPLLELYGMYDSARRQCEKRGLTVVRSLVGNYCTSLDMAGCSITLVKLNAEMRSCGMRRCIRRRCAGECRFLFAQKVAGDASGNVTIKERRDTAG
jgi:dihydroxyacetone kinase